MNSVLENIRNRRSIRRFKAQPVARNLLETIIEAGNQAPSGSNAQPWRFVVVEDSNRRQRLAEITKPFYDEWLKTMPQTFQEMRAQYDPLMPDPIYYSAPAIVFVVGKTTGSAPLDCPMVCENMMLAARSLGLGSCWVHIGSLGISDPEIKNMLKLSDDERVFGPILFGHPEGDFPEPPTKKPPLVEWL